MRGQELFSDNSSDRSQTPTTCSLRQIDPAQLSLRQIDLAQLSQERRAIASWPAQSMATYTVANTTAACRYMDAANMLLSAADMPAQHTAPKVSKRAPSTKKTSRRISGLMPRTGRKRGMRFAAHAVPAIVVSARTTFGLPIEATFLLAILPAYRLPCVMQRRLVGCRRSAPVFFSLSFRMYR